jgi:hypothetical protein
MSATNRSSYDVRPEGGAWCVSSARRDLGGGRGEILVPTATIGGGKYILDRSYCLPSIEFAATLRWSDPWGLGMKRREFIARVGGATSRISDIASALPIDPSVH